MISAELREFDSIRPYEPEELPAVFDRLLSDRQFLAVLGYVFKDVPIEAVVAKIRSCRTNIEFQMNVCYGFLETLLANVSDGLDMDCSAVDRKKRYTFMSNHRDIVLDSAFLDKLLVDNGFETTCELALGDNLLAAPWIEDLVRVNKSFLVRRGLGIRETFVASKQMSEYMHYVLAHKNGNIWIAQREGRAKDSDDRTQPAILKMIAMSGEGGIIDRLKQLHIVPTAISYEYDPCDYLKAEEFQLKRDVEGWKKSSDDDVRNMRAGIMGYKGRIHYHLAPCIDEWLGTIDGGMPSNELFPLVAAHIDEEIHRNYLLYPCNYIALDLLSPRGDSHADKYTAEDKARFESYLASRIALIDIPDKDEAYLRERILTMYANPAVNKFAAAK